MCLSYKNHCHPGASGIHNGGKGHFRTRSCLLEKWRVFSKAYQRLEHQWDRLPMIVCIESTAARKLTFHKIKHLETFHYYMNRVLHSLDVVGISDIYRLIQLSVGSRLKFTQVFINWCLQASLWSWQHNSPGTFGCFIKITKNYILVCNPSDRTK